MKKNYDSAKVVASAALLGNLSSDVIRRMVMFITEETTDDNVICSLLKGIVVNAEIKDARKLAELISKQLNETICEIKDSEIIVRDQNIRITYTCKRYAKTADETRIYNTRREANDEYIFEVKVQDSYRIDINDFDFEDSVEFEIL